MCACVHVMCIYAQGVLVELRDDMSSFLAEKLSATGGYNRAYTATATASTTAATTFRAERGTEAEEGDESDNVSFDRDTSTSTGIDSKNDIDSDNDWTDTQIVRRPSGPHKKRILSFNIPTPKFIKKLLRHKRLSKYGRWVFIQTALFAANFLQNEMVGHCHCYYNTLTVVISFSITTCLPDCD